MATPTKQFTDVHTYHFVDLGTCRAVYFQGRLDRSFSRLETVHEPATGEDHARWLELGEVDDHSATLIVPGDKAREALLNADEFPNTLAELDAYLALHRGPGEPALVMPLPLPLADGTMMTAREIFAEPAKEVSLTNARRFLPVFDSIDCEALDHLENPETHQTLDEKVKVWEVCDYDFDGRRIWELSTVTFEGQPVMIFQRAGREGDDHQRSFIVDKGLFKQANERIFSLARFVYEHDDEGDCITIGMDDVREDVHAFYGSSLSQVRAANVRADKQRALQFQIAKTHPEFHGKAVLTTLTGEILQSADTEIALKKLLHENDIKQDKSKNAIISIHEWMAKSE